MQQEQGAWTHLPGNNSGGLQGGCRPRWACAHVRARNALRAQARRFARTRVCVRARACTYVRA